MIPALILLTAGLILTPFGAATYTHEALTTRDRHTLTAARHIATAGRRALYTGILARLIHGGTYGTPMVTVLLLAAAIAITSLMIALATPPTGHHLAQTGATP